MNFARRNIYAASVDETPRLRFVRKKMINKLIGNIVITMSMILVAYIIGGTYLVYMIIVKGSRVTFLAMELPFVDSNSEFGFWLNISIQSVYAFVGIVGCWTIEISAAIISNSALAIPHLIRVDSEELDRELDLNGVTLAARARLRNVFMKIQDYEKYIYTFSNYQLVEKLNNGLIPGSYKHLSNFTTFDCSLDHIYLPTRSVLLYSIK